MYITIHTTAYTVYFFKKCNLNHRYQESLLLRSCLGIISDKVCMYEELMTNDDNVESNLLTSSFIENT